MAGDWARRADELAAAGRQQGDATGWFDRLYAAGRAGEVSLPWDRTQPQAELRAWAEARGGAGGGRSAVVVGCGLGADAAYLSQLGFATTGFDLSPTAVGLAGERHAASGAEFAVADLLDLPRAWTGSFDLVVEVFTVQALPDPPRTQAVAAIRSLVAPGGTLLAIAFRTDADDDAATGPPYALSRRRMASFAGGPLGMIGLERLDGRLWRAECRRQASSPSTSTS